MVLNTRNFWIFELCSSSGILKNTVLGKPDLFSSSGEDSLSYWVRYKDLTSITGKRMSVLLLLHIYLM
jgi:hypothetical protein